MADRPAFTDEQVELIGQVRSALKETVVNVERLTEEAERVLRRARGRLEDLELVYLEISEVE